MTRLARLSILLITLTAALCWRLGESFPMTLTALIGAYGLALTIDEYKVIDRLVRRLSKPKSQRLV